MSLSLHPVPVVAVYNPIDDLDEKVIYTAEKGAQNVTSYIFNASNTSNSGCVFIANPPNTKTTMDRRVFVDFSIAIKFTGTTTDGGNLLRPLVDAPRAFPLSSVISTTVASINNTNVNLSTAQVIHPLSRMNFDVYTRKYVNGGCPTTLDVYPDYPVDTRGFARNPLSGYGSSTTGSDENRGFDDVPNAPYNNSNAWVEILNNTDTEAEVVIRVREPLWLAPFSTGKGEHKGFNNVQTFTINLTFNAGLSRVWSHMAIPEVNFTNVQVQMGSGFKADGSFDFDPIPPRLECIYHTPDPLYKVPDVLQYDYYEIIRYSTQGKALGQAGSVAPNPLPDDIGKKSNNIILNSIPHKILIYAKRQDSDLFGQDGYLYSDTYLRLDGLNILFNNKSGICSQMSEYQLYQMSRKNGLNMSYQDWYVAGSPIIVSPASDFGMNNSSETNGVQGQYNFQVTVNVHNQTENALTYDLNIIVISEGILTLEVGGRTMTELACLSHKDVLDATSKPWMKWSELRKYGGSMFSSFRRQLPASKLAKRGLGSSGGAVSGGAVSGGAVSGGELVSVSKAHLKKALRNRIF